MPLRFCLFLLSICITSAAWVETTPRSGSFKLADSSGAAVIWHSDEEPRVVKIAASHLAKDISLVTSQQPIVSEGDKPPGASVVIIGTLGTSALISDLVSSGKLAVPELAGKWESFVVTVVRNPLPGVEDALVIAGSDRRGTAFGVYEVSQAIGVSPWHWWSDVRPALQPALYFTPGERRFGPPSVKYRGIFINDEDWALQPWAALTHEPESGNIGPKTYERVFELLLRLKANLLWPGMHPTTRPFNALPENAKLADDYAIVMGSSHAEPMLRNNVGEWKEPSAKYNYVENREGVLRYWEERAKSNGRFESVFTLGMRGIHDSGMVGASSDSQRIELLHQIFSDQRELLKKYVSPDVEAVPQMFCAYKEVLDLYRGGLNVPDDVTIVWPDDNFGYIRNFTSEAERKRRGGSGVYYHLSYLGRPLSYLWLATTPPALVWEEMRKAYDLGASRLWVVNIGDIKPAEITTEFFLQMAWDIERWNHDGQDQYLRGWAAREFGPEHSGKIAEALSRYYLLNYTRKPEHLQWWLPGQRPKNSELTERETVLRMQAFEKLSEDVAEIKKTIPTTKQDAFFELIEYPLVGAASANERFFHSERYARHFNHEFDLARSHAAAALQANDRLEALTAHYGELANGKWRHFMSLEPADNQWLSMRISPLPLPARSFAAGAKPARFQDLPVPSTPPERIEIDAGDFSTSKEGANARWLKVQGLGHSGKAVMVQPVTAESVDPSMDPDRAPFLEYEVTLPESGEIELTLEFLPTHPIGASRALRAAVAFDTEASHLVTLPIADGSPEWGQGVLTNRRSASIKRTLLSAGKKRLRLYMVDAGVVVDRIVITRPRPAAD